jgi:hypothetical protein
VLLTRAVEDPGTGVAPADAAPAAPVTGDAAGTSEGFDARGRALDGRAGVVDGGVVVSTRPAPESGTAADAAAGVRAITGAEPGSRVSSGTVLAGEAAIALTAGSATARPLIALTTLQEMSRRYKRPTPGHRRRRMLSFK